METAHDYLTLYKLKFTTLLFQFLYLCQFPFLSFKVKKVELNKSYVIVLAIADFKKISNIWVEKSA